MQYLSCHVVEGGKFIQTVYREKCKRNNFRRKNKKNLIFQGKNQNKSSFYELGIRTKNLSLAEWLLDR
jgi:hypothetical protein